MSYFAPQQPGGGGGYQPPQPPAQGINVGGKIIQGYVQAQRAVQDATICTQKFTTLKLEAGVFTDNTGRSTEMMKVAGLLPIAFRGVTYNIPICVWVPQQYPTMPPTPFVQPTPDMDVVRGHQHVGADGMCYFPYCNQWSPHSSASGLLDAMVAAFSAHPPVTARAPPVQQAQAAPAPAPQYQPPPVVGRGGGYSQPYTAKPTGGGACSVPAPSPAPAPPPTYQTSGTEQQVTARIVDGMNRRGQELQTEMGKLLDDQTELQQGQTRLDTGMQQLREEQAGLERYLAWLNHENAELRTWLEEHPETEIDPDTIVVPADPLSAQLLEETTRDEAISDTLYELGRAFHDMAGDSDADTQTRGLTAYLKEVTRLSKQQFRSKALQSKIKVRSTRLQTKAHL